MPVEVESSGQLSEVGRVLRRRLAWILIPFALITSLGTAFAVIVPKKFVARTKVMVHEGPSGRSGSAGQEQGKVATHLIRSPTKVKNIIDKDLGWPFQQLTEAEQEDLIEKVLSNLHVDTPNMGLNVKQQVVLISYADTNRGRAFEFLSAISERWRTGELEKSRTAALAEFAKMTELKQQMETRRTAIGDEIAELNRTNNVPPWTPDRRGDRPLDPAFDSLAELGTNLAELELELEDDALDLAAKTSLYELMDDEVPFEQTEEGLSYDEEIQALKEANLEWRQEIQRQGYKTTHSTYREIQEQIRENEEHILLLTESTRSTLRDEEMVPNTGKLELADELERDRIAFERKQARHLALGREVDDAEARTKELQAVYQQLETLYGERLILSENLIAVGDTHALMRRDLDRIMSAEGDPFTILDEPKMPVRPTEPDPILIVLFSVLASLALGLGLALILEYSRNCFRSLNDITRVMVVPVLGTVNSIVTRRDRRRAALGRLLVGGSTLGFVLAVGFVTWAWASRPDLLTDDLRQSIETLRASFE